MCDIYPRRLSKEAVSPGRGAFSPGFPSPNDNQRIRVDLDSPPLQSRTNRRPSISESIVYSPSPSISIPILPFLNDPAPAIPSLESIETQQPQTHEASLGSLSAKKKVSTIPCDYSTQFPLSFKNDESKSNPISENEVERACHHTTECNQKETFDELMNMSKLSLEEPRNQDAPIYSNSASTRRIEKKQRNKYQSFVIAHNHRQRKIAHRPRTYKTHSPASKSHRPARRGRLDGRRVYL